MAETAKRAAIATLVVGPLTVGHVAGPKEVCQLVEELAT